MTREQLIEECTKLAEIAGASVPLVRALDLLGDDSRARQWALEVAPIETDILSKVLRDGLSTEFVAERFARVIYVESLAGDLSAVRRYEQALRVFWQEKTRGVREETVGLRGTAQAVLVCATLLMKVDLAAEVAHHLPEGPWREFARAWGESDCAALASTERQLAADIAAAESLGGLSLLSDSWSYLMLDRLRRRLDGANATA